MTDERLRSLELLEQLIEMASRSGRFWRTFGRIAFPAKAFEDLLGRIVEEIPVDVKKAKEMLAERDKLMDDAVSKSEKIVDDAVEEASRLLDDSEIAKKARRMAAAIRDDADKFVVESLERLEDEVAELLSRIKKAQSSIIADMERRREESEKEAE